MSTSALGSLESLVDTLFAYHGFDLAGFGLTLWSLIALGNHHRSGFLLGGLAAIAWTGFALQVDSIPTVVANLTFLGLNVRGWWNWKRRGLDDVDPQTPAGSA